MSHQTTACLHALRFVSSSFLPIGEFALAVNILPTFFVVVLLLSQTVISPPSSWSSPRARRTHCHSQTLKTTTCESYLSRAFLELSRTAAANILSQGQPPTVSNVLNKNNQMSKPTLRSRNNRGQSNRGLVVLHLTDSLTPMDLLTHSFS